MGAYRQRAGQAMGGQMSAYGQSGPTAYGSGPALASGSSQGIAQGATQMRRRGGMPTMGQLAVPGTPLHQILQRRMGAFGGIPGGPPPVNNRFGSGKLGLNLGLNPMQRNAFRMAAGTGNLGGYMAAHPMLQQRFAGRMLGGGPYAGQAQSYINQNAMNPGYTGIGGQGLQPGNYGIQPG